MEYYWWYGFPPADVSDLSDNKCRCHFNRGQGQKVFYGDSMCKSTLQTINLIPEHWLYVEKAEARLYGPDHCALRD